MIYIGLAVWAIRFIRGNRDDVANGKLPVSVEAAHFAASCVLNILWLTAWHLHMFPVSVFVIILLLVAVAALYMLTRRRSPSWLDRAPVAVYASWLAVATVANIAHVVTRSVAEDSGIVPAVSTIVLLVLFVVVTFFMRRFLGDYAFGVVVAWAGIGIGVRLASISPLVGVAVILISTLGVAAALLPWERLYPALKGEPR